MADLTEYRKEIDAIDREMAALFEQRMDVVAKVAAYKLARGVEVLQPERETELIRKVQSLLKSDVYKGDIAELYESILAISRKYQEKLMAETGEDAL